MLREGKGGKKEEQRKKKKKTDCIPKPGTVVNNLLVISFKSSFKAIFTYQDANEESHSWMKMEIK